MKKLLFICLFSAACLLAQDGRTLFYQNLDLQTGAYYQTWKTENGQSISQFSIPIGFTYPVNNYCTMSLGTSSAFSSSSNSSKTLSGLTDTRIMGSYLLMDEQLLVSGGVTLPTGKSKLKEDEGSIAGSVGLYPLAFRVPSFGQGFSFNLSGSYAFELGDYILGAGAGFIYKAGFTPFENSSATYVPGTEIALNVGGEKSYEVGIYDMRITADLSYTMYGKDTYKDKEVFRSGSKILFDVRSILTAARTEWTFYLRERSKGKNDKGVGTLQTESKNSNGNQLELGAVGAFKMRSGYTLRGFADLKLYSQNEYKNNGATIFGIGAGANKPFTDRLSLDGLIKVSFGTLSDQSRSTSVTGFEIGAGLRYKF